MKATNQQKNQREFGWMRINQGKMRVWAGIMLAPEGNYYFSSYFPIPLTKRVITFDWAVRPKDVMPAPYPRQSRLVHRLFGRPPTEEVMATTGLFLRKKSQKARGLKKYFDVVLNPEAGTLTSRPMGEH